MKRTTMMSISKSQVMRRLAVLLVLAMSVTGAMAQGQIKLNPKQQTGITKSDFSNLRATFSYESIEANEVVTERGSFSELTMGNTFAEGSIGAPELTATHELLAVPLGANPVVRVVSYSTTDYRLSDYGISEIMPRQQSVRTDQDPSKVDFAYDAKAYQTRGLAEMPEASIEVMGTMRGVQLGRLVVKPMSYNASDRTLRVFNDIEVEVDFEGADLQATEQQLVDTYSPYFEVAYQQLFNGRDIPEIYAQHPDLYTTPVKMMVVTTPALQQMQPFQDWVNWKKQKGIAVEVYNTDQTGTTSSDIQSFIDAKYNLSHPSFLVIVGDRYDVVHSDEIYTGETGNYVSDMEYADVTGDRFPEMYVSRMPVSNVTDLGNLVNKIIAYEQYTMTDPSYLNNAVLIGGVDNAHNTAHCQPAVHYAVNNYFNAAHGFNNVYPYYDSYNGCYDHFGEGLGMIYYTGNGWHDYWTDPRFSTTDVTNLPDEANGKYFWAFGNCCLAANWGASVTSLAEKLLTEENKGAFGYIGACTYSYWDEDYYFALGANPYRFVAPPVEQSTTGVFDALFMDDMYNSLNSFTLVGNLAVEYAHGYTNYEVNHNLDAEPEYYWKAYQTLGDGSVMPYQTAPRANTISHASILSVGATSLTVYADAGSYVSLTKDNEIQAVALVGSTGVVTLNMAAATAGTMKLVVTRPQRQPYMADITFTNQVGVHNVICSPTVHGTISADKATATAGEFVTLTIAPEAGYSLATLAVIDGNSQPVSVANNRFAMPNSDVTVTATFAIGRVITIASTMHGTVQASALLGVSGDRITLTATPADGYVFDCWTGYKSDNISTPVYITNNEFELPDYDVTISGTFKLAGGSGGTIEIGTNGGVHSWLSYTNVPTKTNCSYVITEQIYQSFELGANNGNITDIAFKSMSASTATRNLCIYMTYTSLKNFENDTQWKWIDMPLSSKVFEGNVTFQANGWTTIHLNTPFAYTSGNGILLGICDNTGYGSTLLEFDCSDEGGKRAIWSTGDSAFDISQATTYCSYNPQYDRNLIRFIMGVEGVPECITYSPTSLIGISAIKDFSTTPKSFSIVARQLESNVTVTAPTHYEVCTSANGTYTNSLSLTPTDHTVATMVYVRLKASVALGNYNNEILTIAAGTSSKTITLSGSMVAPVSYTITASVDPVNSGTVTGAGQYVINSQVELNVKSNTGYRFLYWTESNSVVSTDMEYSFTATEDRDLVAHFEEVPTYTITATADPVGSGTITGAGLQEEDATATLVATANAGYRFVNWTEEDVEVATTATYSFTVTEDRTLVAHFEEVPTFTIIATANPSAGGSVSGAGVLEQGTQASLTAIANSGYYFSGWTENGEQVSVYNPYQFNVSSDRVLVANFEATPVYHIAVATITNGTVAANISSGAYGTQVTLTATPSDGYTFGEWYVYKSDDVNTAVTVTGNAFTLPAYDVTVAASFNAQGGGGQGGVITIGTGESNQPDLPINVYFEYYLSEQIYTASEIGTAGTINSIAVRNYMAFEATRNIDMYMKHTSMSQFGSMENFSSSDKVFSGSIKFNKNSVNDGWTVITLSTPFVYNGTSNLLICFDDNTGNWGNQPQFYVFNSSKSAAYASSESTNLNPANASGYDKTVKGYKNIIKLDITAAAAGGSSESLAVSPAVISGFMSVAGGAASEAKAFSVVASGLESNVSVTAPTHYQVCATEDGTYGSSINLAPSDGEVKAMVYVRLKDHLSDGVYNNEKVTVSSGDAELQVTVNGEAHDNLHVIENAQVVNADLNLDSYNQYVITSTGKLTVNGSMSNTNPAYLIIRDGGQVYFTEGTVQAEFHKNIEASSSDTDGWKGIASPITNATLLNHASNTYDIYAYDEDADQEEWQNYRVASFGFTNGQGYLYANNTDTDITMKGQLVNEAAVIIPLSYNATYEDIKGFNLIGNPFAHNITMSDVKVGGVAITEYWRIGADGQLERCTSGVIKPGESFFVKVNESGKNAIIENTIH